MKYQKSNLKRRSSKSHKVVSAWSIVCAIELGLLQKSSLKDVTILSYLDLNFLRTTKDAQRSFDFETSDHEDVVSDRISASIFGSSWPFIDPAQITQITSSKSVRRRSKKRRWSTKRQRKPNLDNACWDINDATTNLSIKRAASSLPENSPCENLGVSNDSPTGLSENKFSLTQLDARWSERDNGGNRKRLSGSCGSADEDEGVSQATLETSSGEIPQTDYSGAGYSKFYTPSSQKKESQNRMELSEYPDYFSNVLRIDDNNTEDDDSDTSNWDIYNTRGTKLTKFVESVPRQINKRTSIKNRNTLGNSIRRSSRKKTQHLRNNKSLNTEYKSNKTMRWRGKSDEKKSVTYDHYTLLRKVRKSRLKRDGKDRFIIGTHKAKIKRRRYDDCNAQRHSYNFTNAAYAYRNLKSTATAIMRDIQTHIRNAETAKDDVENIRDLTMYADSSDEKPDDKDLDRDISMEYDWIGLENNGELNNGEISPQKSKQLFDTTNAALSESLIINFKRRGHKKKSNRYTIDCKFVDRMETAYRSVFHECVDFDSLLATSSLKINMDESWRSEDNDSDEETSHSSWRRSVSFTEECDKDFDSALLLARKIVSDDSAKGEKCYDDEHETLKSTCYKYHDTSDVYATISKDTPVNNSCSDEEDMKVMNDKMKSIITYKKRSKCVWSSVQVNRKFVKSGNDKVQGRKNNKTNNMVHLMRRDLDGKTTDLEYDCDKREYVPRRITRALVKTTKENHPGKLVWGNCSGWWPALIVDAEHVGMAPCSDKLWVFWIGEKQISSLKEKTQIQPFSKNLEHRLTQPSRKIYRLQAIDATMQMLRQRFNCTLTKPYYHWIQRNITEFESLDDLTFYPYPKNIQKRLDTLKETNIKVTKKNLLNERGLPEATPIKKQAIEQHKNTSTSWEEIIDERLLLQDQNHGEIAWAKIAGHRWWPAMIIDYRDCNLKEPSFSYQWVMWYGDYQVSEVHHLEFLKFYKGLEKMHDSIKNAVKKPYLDGVLQASKDYCARLGCCTDNWTLDNVFEYFSNKNNMHVPYKKVQVSNSNKIYDKYSDEIVKKINEFKSKPNVDEERTNDIKTSDALRRVISGECAVEKLCLKCLSFPKGRMEEHPFFIGSLCKECSDVFKPCMFVHGKDGKCFYCTVCASAGTILICDADCPRVYCTACLKFLVCPKSYDKILLEDPWHCFLCKDESKQPDNMLLRPRLDWKEKFSRIFRTDSNPASDDAVLLKCKKKRPIRVLSLFDGLSTGFLVLLNLRMVVDVYYASEIDTDVMTISSAHFGDRITQLGDVRNITKEKIQEIAPIDLLIGGSPCNDLSLVNPARLGLHDRNGTGILFFEYTRIKNLVMKANKGRHMFWLYENVASMPSEYRLEINKRFGQEPDVIDAADFSPQHRLRLYWHNLPFNPYMPLFQNQQDVQDKLTPNLNRNALCKKLRTVTTRSGSLLQPLGKTEVKPIMMKGASDNLWITELEEIFGFPRHYTDVKNLSATKRQKLLGKSWSVQTLTAILRPLCFYFKCNEDEISNNTSTSYENMSPLYHGKRF